MTGKIRDTIWPMCYIVPIGIKEVTEMPKPREIGKSGFGPKGRPKGALNKATKCIKAIAEPWGEAAVTTLRKIMQNPRAPFQARVSAAQALLDRGFGRPHATSDVNLTETQSFIRAPSKSTDEEWKELLARRQAAATELAPKPKQPAIAPKADGKSTPKLN